MALVIFIIGLIVGSFLNVVVYRLPRGESVVFPPSHCPECNHKLTPLELIPVVSYIYLKGKCSSCGKKISLKYPLVELITGTIFLSNYLLLFDIILFVSGLIFSSILIVLFFIDLEHQILPDKITLGGLGVGIILSFLRHDITIISALLGLFAAGGLLFIVALVSKGGLGGGDIKMMAMAGTFLGPLSAVAAVFLGAVFGLLASLPQLISGKLKRKSKIPFGPFLALSSLIFWFWGNNFWNWYLNLILR